MKKTLYSVAIAALFSTAMVNAQDTTITTAPADAGKLTISGYLDSYYITAFNRPPSGNLVGFHNNPTSGTAVGYGRAFDRLTDQFALGLVQARLAYSTAKSDMVIDLTFGPNAELGNFGNQRMATGQGYTTGFFPNNANQSALYGTSAAIKQAYFTYKFTDKWSFTVGQFGTHIGYEVIDAPVNYHYSLSNLFNNGPFYHIGAKTQYLFSDQFGLMLGVVNNWDALTDWKSQKSIIGQLFVSPVTGWNLYVNYIGGYNDDGFKVFNNAGGTKFGTRVGNAAYPDVSRGYIRQMVDITTGYQITDRFYVGLNAALGWYSYQLNDASAEEFGKPDPNATKTRVFYTNKAFGKTLFADSSKYQSWGGVAVYTNYKISDMLGIGLRYEHFDDRNGVRYLNGVNNSLTITMPITLADGHVIIKPEFRWDTGNLGGTTYDATENKTYTVGPGLYETRDDDAIKNGAASTTAAPTSGQSTIGLAFIYKY